MTKPKHGAVVLRIESHEPVRLTWYATDCACGWQSPFCESPQKADKLYEAHKRRKKK